MYIGTAKDFRWPQIWRNSLGLDFRVQPGTIFSADIAYSKDIHAQMVDAAGHPVFNFDPSLRNTFIASPDLISRWQMQFGLRYIF